MKSITPFDVALVPFPFADLSTSKRRPCLVLAMLAPKRLPRHYVVCMITSQLDGLAFEYDHQLEDFSTPGLPKPSLVRVAKLVAIEQAMLLKRLGKLAAPDREQVRQKLRHLFQLER